MSVTDHAGGEVNRGYLGHIRSWSARTLGRRSPLRLLVHGMLFLLADELRFIADQYSSERAAEIPAEHV